MTRRPTVLTETTPHETFQEGSPREAVWGLVWVWPQVRFTPLERTETRLGRDPESTVVLESQEVSREHAVVQPRAGGYAVTDLGSRNGTYVGGLRVSDAPLQVGATLRIGDWVGVFCQLPASFAHGSEPFSEPIPGLIVGPRSRASWDILEQLARSEQPLLIEGPTGTGKEVIARAIHERSGRQGPFVAINCAAIPEALAEAQLFGHVKGAFTGAAQNAAGLIASAEGGTLLLDEIADLPLGQQVKLLRAIEERAVLRVGETTPRPVNVRYLAACQQSLWKLSQQGRFRADLVGRLAGGRLALLPLAERREEVPGIFLRYFEAAGGLRASVSATAIEALCLATWPLNVRQVVQCARLAAIHCRSYANLNGSALKGLLDQVHADGLEGAAGGETQTLAEGATGQSSDRRARWLSRHQAELEPLLAKLKECNGNVSEACRQLGLPRWRAVRMLSALEEQR